MILKSIKSFRYAFKGIYQVFRYENNAKIHSIATLLVLATGWYVHLTKRDWLWIALCICLVWMTESLNSAIEKLVDLVSPDHHPVAGKVKDMAAGAVLLAALFSVITALIIFSDYI